MEISLERKHDFGIGGGFWVGYCGVCTLSDGNQYVPLLFFFFLFLFFQVLVHLGLLTKESGFKIAETAFSGGPLGELVQWSDLITSLYLLGHDIRISASLAELKE